MKFININLIQSPNLLYEDRRVELINIKTMKNICLKYRDWKNNFAILFDKYLNYLSYFAYLMKLIFFL